MWSMTNCPRGRPGRQQVPDHSAGCVELDVPAARVARAATRTRSVDPRPASPRANSPVGSPDAEFVIAVQLRSGVSSSIRHPAAARAELAQHVHGEALSLP